MGGFDYLRLIAAILVIAHHARVLDGRPPLVFGSGLDLGALGVGIFFVISGYLVAGSWARSPRLAPFLAKRALRIFPGLLVTLLITAFAIGPLTTTLPLSDYFRATETYGYVLRNITLYAVTYDLPGVFATAPVAKIVNGSLWTLRLEATAYVGLALVSGLRRAAPLALESLAALAAIAAIALHATGLDAREDLFRIAYLAALNGFLFLAGAALQANGKQPRVWMAVLALALLATPAWYLGLPLAVIRLGALPLPNLPADLSYGLYIYAFPLQQALVQHQTLNLATSLAVTAPFAAASWFLVEKPALRLKTRFGGRDEAAVSPAS